MGDYLSPWEIAAYQNRSDQVATSYKNSLAGQEYRRATFDTQFGRAKDSQNLQWDRAMGKLPGSFVGRGIAKSGIYQNALANYGIDRTRAADNLNFDYTNQIGGLAVEAGQNTNTYNTSLAGIAAEQAARRAELATQLREMQ